ncbi:MAG: SpoIVB peptidase [Clostridiales bacterium]|jgi:stage IV sporulation protein B|nr:SpoIVB peptidase [Clostridiales bacterium]
MAKKAWKFGILLLAALLISGSAQMGATQLTNAQISEEIRVIPGGTVVGIKIWAGGIIVADVEKKSPASKAGLRKGDFITTIGGEKVETVQDFTAKTQAIATNQTEFLVEREGRHLSMKITPEQDLASGEYKVGAWVRDAAAGVGTMTYTCPETGEFGALGHAVTDIDTHTLVPLGSGKIVSCEVIGVQASEAGAPGELRGVFSSAGDALGVINENKSDGIYGSISGESVAARPSLRIANRDEVQTGVAYILATVEGQNVQQFEIEIERINPSDGGNRELMLRVTDADLLEKTGGIVQGMSGCPIIQNDALVGAITYVFINDPTRGYGILAENMINDGL